MPLSRIPISERVLVEQVEPLVRFGRRARGTEARSRLEKALAASAKRRRVRHAPAPETPVVSPVAPQRGDAGEAEDALSQVVVRDVAGRGAEPSLVPSLE